MTSLEIEKGLQQKVAELPREMTPERDLWQGIENAIHDKSQDHTLSGEGKKHKAVPLAWAASVVAAVLFSWITFGPQSQLGSENGVDQTLVNLLVNDFEQQKQGLLVSFGQPKLSELAPDMKQQLEHLKKARESIEKALINDPNNTDLINLLRWTQRQELELLETIYTPQWQTI